MQPNEYIVNGRTLRVLTGTTVYRLSSIRNDPSAGKHVWTRPVLGDELGPPELVRMQLLAKREHSCEGK